MLTLPESEPLTVAGGQPRTAVRQVKVSWSRHLSIGEGHVFDRGVADWFQCVMAWVCAWTGVAPPVDRPVAAHLEQFDRDGQLVAREPGMFQFYAHTGDAGATCEQLEAAFQFASERVALPTEYALLVDAQAAYGDFRNRVCLISGTGAAEVSLGKTIKKVLAAEHACTADFVEWVETRSRGLLALWTRCAVH